MIVSSKRYLWSKKLMHCQNMHYNYFFKTINYINKFKGKMFKEIYYKNISIKKYIIKYSS